MGFTYNDRGTPYRSDTQLNRQHNLNLIPGIKGGDEVDIDGFELYHDIGTPCRSDTQLNRQHTLHVTYIERQFTLDLYLKYPLTLKLKIC